MLLKNDLYHYRTMDYQKKLIISITDLRHFILENIHVY